MRPTLAAALLAVMALVTACGGGPPGPDASPSQQGNLFQNPGFEEGRDPWFSLNPPDFLLASDLAHDGQASALLRMRATLQDQGTKVFYLVQEITPQQFPELLSGYYRVGKWARGTPLQYLQVAVIAFGVENLPGGYPNHQIRYILAGIDQEPFKIANAHFVFLSKDDPPLDRWVAFERRVGDDFRQLWGATPEGSDMIRILFEVRYDDKAPGQGTPEADVYYDDLNIGPAPPSALP